MVKFVGPSVVEDTLVNMVSLKDVLKMTQVTLQLCSIKLNWQIIRWIISILIHNLLSKIATSCKGGPIDYSGRRNAIQSRACANLIKGFTFNRTTSKCEPFAQGGCKMSGNGFVSKIDCENACGPASWMPKLWSMPFNHSLPNLMPFIR